MEPRAATRLQTLTNPLSYGVHPIQINELISITNVLIPKTRMKYLQNFYNSGEFLGDWWKEDDWYFEVINVSLNLLKSKQVVIVIKKLCVDFFTDFVQFVTFIQCDRIEIFLKDLDDKCTKKYPKYFLDTNWIELGHIHFNIDRQLVDPARLPLLTVVVM